MVVQKPMAYNPLHQKCSSQQQVDGRLINDILQRIQNSSRETCLWEKPIAITPKIAASTTQINESPIATTSSNTSVTSATNTKETCFWENSVVNAPNTTAATSAATDTKETCFLENRLTVTSPTTTTAATVTSTESKKSPQRKISEKRADFFRSMYSSGDKIEVDKTEVDKTKENCGVNTIEESTNIGDNSNNGDKRITDLEDIDRGLGIDFWSCMSFLDNETSVDDTPVFQNEEPKQDVTKTNKRPGLVRRRSSVDSGIVVRTLSEKMQDREKSLLLMAPSTLQSKTELSSPSTPCNDEIAVSRTNKGPVTLSRSNSLPNLGDLDLDKFKTIRFKNASRQTKMLECVNDVRAFEGEVVPQPPKRNESVLRTKHKDLFSIRNYMTGKYRKTKLSEYIKRNNTFSLGEARFQTSPMKTNQRRCPPSSIMEENYVLSFDINSTDQMGDTCLHYASSKGDTDTVKYLLQQGGNVWRKNKSQQVPMEVSKDFNTAKLLSHATIFYAEPEKLLSVSSQNCNNISSTVKVSFEL